MASRAPVFPMPDEQRHYSDYGFDPQMDYFQVLEEARRHGKRSAADMRSPDAIRFTLRKPISKDDRSGAAKRRKWWKSALLFWKRDGAGSAVGKTGKASVAARRAVSGPVYMVEGGGRSGSSTPCRTSRLPGSGPLGEGVGHYLSLRDFNVMDADDDGRISAGAVPAHMPVYLVT